MQELQRLRSFLDGVLGMCGDTVGRKRDWLGEEHGMALHKCQDYLGNDLWREKWGSKEGFKYVNYDI